jgi:hypothetical protein
MHYCLDGGVHCTNNLQILDEFIGRSDTNAYVIKPISDAGIAYQNNVFTETPDFASFESPFTKIFKREEVTEGLVDETPFLIQQKIEKVSEIRCVVIDGKVLASESEFFLQKEVDIRLQSNRQEKPVTLPTSLSENLVRFTKALNLRFCSLDFCVDAYGNPWLTDVNPAGNWLWQEQQLHLGIARNLASALIRS